MNSTKTSQSKPMHRTIRFFSEDIWDLDLSSLSRIRRLGVNIMRIIILVFKGFRENECPLHAAALTYYSLMAIVPFLALTAVIVRSLGIGGLAEQKVLELAAIMPDRIKEFIFQFLDYVRNTDFTTLGIIGLALLAWIVVQVLKRIEMSFNRIWGVAGQQRLSRRLADYFSIIIIVPVLLIGASVFNASLASSNIADLIETRIGLGHFIYYQTFLLMPLVAVWVAFIFLYTVMTNTRVSPLPAIVGGVIGGSIWLFWQMIYLQAQIAISQFNAIYAAFASVPVFLLWVYISWQIVLFGAEIGFALQNYSTYKMEQKAHGASALSKVMLALSVISHAAQPMLINVPYFRIASYARSHRVPVRLLNEVVAELVAAGFLMEVAGGEGQYVLLKAPGTVQVRDVFNAMLRSGTLPQSLGLERLNPAIRHVLGKMDAGAAAALKDFSITDLLQLHARLEQSPLVDSTQGNK